jgi:hypothetical protein
MAVVHEHVPPADRLSREGVGLARQQGIGITAGAVGLVAELDGRRNRLLPVSCRVLERQNPHEGLTAVVADPSCPSIHSSEAWDAQACSSVPSTEKCSSLSSGLTSGAPISFCRNRPMTCSFSSRSLFLVNVVGCQMGSSGLKTTNQRNSRLELSCSNSNLSERIP